MERKGSKVIDYELVTDGVLKFFSELDYQYMIFQTILCYGLYYSKNFEWLCRWFAPVRKKGRDKAVWVFGSVFAVLEMFRFLPFIGFNGLWMQKCMSILHSFVIIQVFVEPLVNTVEKYIGIAKRITENKELQ